MSNYLLKKRKMDDVWVAQPQVGLLNFLGIDIHQYFVSSFFRDHDFVIVRNKTTEEVIAVDPTVHDYLLLDYVAFEK